MFIEEATSKQISSKELEREDRVETKRQRQNAKGILNQQWSCVSRNPELAVDCALNYVKYV